ncbi:MAG: VPLPA-CTERM sorting domain-containing protein [Pseudooceanicola sp.]
MKNLLRAACFSLVTACPGVLTAATLTATFADDFNPNSFEGASGGTTAFEIDFDDTLGTMAGVLEGAEFLSFTWINNPFTFNGGDFRELLGNAPTIAGIVEAFTTPDFPGTPNPAVWVFRQAPGSGTNSVAGTDVFTYAITPDADPGVVPLPASLPILGAGLAGLFAIRRRKRGA